MIYKMGDAISHRQLAVGHLKFYVQSGDWEQKISYASNDQKTKQRAGNKRLADHASILINARVETDPDQLREIFSKP